MRPKDYNESRTSLTFQWGTCKLTKCDLIITTISYAAVTRTVAPRKILTEMRSDAFAKAGAERVLVRRQVKITSEPNTIERRDDGPVTRVVPRFIIVPNMMCWGRFNYIGRSPKDNEIQKERKRKT